MDDGRILSVGYGKNVRQALIMVTQFSIEMLVPIFLCSLIGWWLDSKFETSWIFVLGFFIGAFAGAWNVFRYARRIYSAKSGDVRNRDKVSANTHDSGQNNTQMPTDRT